MGVAVKRYPFPVSEWCRTIWPSPAARDTWAPRLSAIAAAREAVELASVGQVRLAARVPIDPSQYPEFSRKATSRGLVAVALQQEAITGSYQARPSGSPIVGDHWQFQAALCATPPAAKAFVAAWERSDDRVIGELLGFPKCCVDFYERIWKDAQWLDTTWPMARASLHRALSAETEIEIHPSAPVEANILLRWLGVRWAPHLPCSFDCAGTVAFGKQLRDVMRNGFAQEAAWTDELLSSSIEWSAWHGIAEIKTPVVKISTKTDATVERLVVQRPGTRVPAAAARGNAFPYTPAPSIAPLKFHGLGGVAKPTWFVVDGPPERIVPQDLEWTDNGFSTLEAMQHSHDTIARFYREHVTADRTRHVLDLGCGNGRLMAMLTDNPVGVERDRDVAARAVTRNPKASIFAQPMQDFIKSIDRTVFDCILLMPGRLEEMTPTDRSAMRAWLKSHARQVVVYAYGDWIKRRSGGLWALCKQVGLVQSHHLTTQNQWTDGGPDVVVGLLDMEAEW